MSDRPGIVVAFHDSGLGGPLRSHEPELHWLCEVAAVTVLIPAGGEVAQPFEALRGAGAEVVPGPYGPIGVPRSPRGLLEAAARSRRERRWFGSVLERSRPRLALAITSTLPGFLWAAKRAGVPSLVASEEIWVGAGRGPLRAGAGRALLALEARLAETTIACSQGVAAQLGRRSDVVVIHPGIEQPDPGADGPGFRRAHGVAADAPLIACIGAVTPGRGQDVLVGALPALVREWPGLRCVIQGDPFPREPDREFSALLERSARALGVQAEILRLPAGPVDGLLAAADVVVNPATAHAESFARVPLEAGLAGVPAVSTRSGVIEDLHADGQTALLVAPGDGEALGAAIARVLRDPGLGSRLAAGSAALARRIASPQRHLDEYRRLLGSRLSL